MLAAHEDKSMNEFLLSLVEEKERLFHKAYEEMKKTDLHSMLMQGFKDSYEGKTTRLTNEDLDKWEKMLDE